MSSFISYIRSKQFFIQLAVIIVLIVLVFFGTLRFLSSYTKHGEFVVVPDFVGKQIPELESFVTDKRVAYQIIDSIYDPAEKPGIVLRQDPEAESKVKHNRTVYLYVTGMVPPQIAMPRLIDRSERQARLIIETYGLKTGQVKEKEADCNGCILAQLVNGKEIEPGQPVKKGSVVQLVVGRKGHFFHDTADSSAADNQDPE
jgi:eukaryotic-like serine/threonine-protein kinase